MRKLILASLLVLCSLSASSQTPEKHLALKDTNGKKFKLSDFKGKVILLNFWATWCPPCRKEMPEMIELQRKYRTAGLQVIGITYPPQKLSEVRRFIRKLKANYPIALGTKNTKLLFTTSDVLPITIVFDRAGQVREVIEGILLPEEFEEKIKPLLSSL